MINEVNEECSSVQFCELVEHPGGHDGGEFPQYHTYSLHDNVVVYATDLPVCSCDAFCDESQERFYEVDTAAEALEKLRERLALADASKRALEKLVKALEEGATLERLWEGEPEEDGGDEDEEDDTWG